MIDFHSLNDLTIRNKDIISDLEQYYLGSSTILIAGCGSVGGSIIEPLARIGMKKFILADPDIYDLTNINRQFCNFSDLGRKKVDVLSEKLKKIHPYINTDTYSEGINIENIQGVFAGVNIVFDGIDAETSLWEKYLLHEEACAKRIPVLSGFDFGGKAVIYVFDYRKYPVPFYGNTSREYHQSGDLINSLKWLGYRYYPAEFLPIIKNRLINNEPWPQVSYCVNAMAAIGTRAVIDVLIGRKTKQVICFDVNMSSRRLVSRIKFLLIHPINLFLAYLASKKHNKKPIYDKYDESLFSNHNYDIIQIVKAMIRSPSPHNCQPWVFIIIDNNRIRISWNKDKYLSCIDRNGYAIMYSVGCAIEAASWVSDIEFIYSENKDLFSEDYYFGDLLINNFDVKKYYDNIDTIMKRHTDRNKFIDYNMDVFIINNILNFNSENINISYIKDSCEFIKKQSIIESKRLFSDKEYLVELLNYVNINNKRKVGFSPSSINVGKIESMILYFLKNSNKLVDVFSATGLSNIMSKKSTNSITCNDFYILISTKDLSDFGRIEVGRVMMRIWLTLTQEDISCQPIDFPISSEESKHIMASYFGINQSFSPIFLLRCGKSSLTKRHLSHRMDIKSFIKDI